LLHAYANGAVPPLTATSIAPVAAPKHATSVTVPPAASVAGWVTVNEADVVHACASVTVTP